MEPDNVVALKTYPDLAAAILSGGHARRLGGTNKALLLVGGRTIADRQVSALRTLTPEVFVVGLDTPHWRELGLPVVPDAIPGAGSLGGIYTAITTSPCDRTLVVGCDMPFLSPAFLAHLAAFGDADMVIPRSPRGYEPLCAVYSRACAASIHERMVRGDLRAAVLPPGLRVTEIGPDTIGRYDPDDLLFVNVNTPHDYERATGLFEMKQNPTQDRITDGARTGSSGSDS